MSIVRIVQQSLNRAIYLYLESRSIVTIA